jgi:peptide/nickel transport system permease protein
MQSLGSYIIKRILTLIPVLIGISLIVFILINIAPGDPYITMVDPTVTTEDRQAMLEGIGYYDPLPVKYLRWISRVVQGDLGYSIKYKEPVMDVLTRRLKNTILLMSISLILSITISIPLGVLAAVKKNSLTDSISTIGALIGISIPAFFLALGLVKIFAFDLGWFPVSGMQSIASGYTGIRYIRDVTAHMALPVLVITVVQTASFMRYTRSAMLEVIKQDYIRTARSKGLKEWVVIYKHAFRNAIVSVITVISISAGYLVSGAILTETVFAWPGMGTMLYQAVAFRDYPLVMGGTFILSVSVLAANLIADILYTIMDPRIRHD